MTNSEFKSACKELNWKYQDASAALDISLSAVKMMATNRKIPDDIAEKVERLLDDKTEVKPVKKPSSKVPATLQDALKEIAILKRQIAELKKDRPKHHAHGTSLDMRKVQRSPPKSSLSGGFSRSI